MVLFIAHLQGGVFCLKKIAFFNLKGGVGKTSSAVNVAYILAKKWNKKVLLVDLDPQSSCKRFFEVDEENTVREILIKTRLITECIYKTKYKNLDIIPGTSEAYVSEKELLLDEKDDQILRLKNALKQVDSEYDYCIIDCAPQIGLVNINGLMASDVIYTPLTSDEDSIVGLSNVIEEINNLPNGEIKWGGAFFVMWTNTALFKNIFASLKESLGEKLIDIKIRRTTIVPETTHEKKPLLEYKRLGTATEDYIKLTKYIMKNS